MGCQRLLESKAVEPFQRVVLARPIGSDPSFVFVQVGRYHIGSYLLERCLRSNKTTETTENTGIRCEYIPERHLVPYEQLDRTSGLHRRSLRSIAATS